MLTLKIALRNLARQKRRSLLSGLTLMGGYVLLSFSEASSLGSYSMMIDNFTRDRTGHAQIHRKGYLERPSLTKVIENPSEVTRVLEEVPDLVAYAPRVQGPALAYLNNKTAPIEVMGVDLERESQVTRIAEKIGKAGASGSGAYLGAGAAETLKARVGDELVLISQGADGSVANESFRVQAIVGTQDSSDRMTVYLPLEAAQEFYSMQGRIHELALRFRAHSLSEPVSAEIQRRLQGAGGDLVVSPWQKVEEEFHRAMIVDRKGSVISYGIILFIVAVGVLNVVLMIILERTREFGVLRAVGTRPEGLFGLIVLETFLLSLLSVAAGLLIAIPLNYYFQEVGIRFEHPIEVGGVSMDRLTAEVSFATLSLPAVWVTVSALLVSLLPALRAARIRVVEALRSV